MNRALDASALIALLNGEEGQEVVSRIVSSGDPCYAHAINLAEVYSHFRRVDEATAAWAVARIAAVGVRIREDMDLALCIKVVEWRHAHRMSWADALGIALAQRLSADWITADHHEFDAVDQADAYRVTFIR